MISNIEGRLLKIIGLGFIAWLIPFVFSFAMFILRENYEVYYRAAMVLIGVTAVISLLKVYLPGSYEDLRVEGWFIAIVWLIMSIGLEALFQWIQSPFQFNLNHFFVHQSWIYAYIPVLSIVGGYLAHAVAKRNAAPVAQSINFPRY